MHGKDTAYSASIGIAKLACREVWDLYREVIPLTHSENSNSTLKPMIQRS